MTSKEKMIFTIYFCMGMIVNCAIIGLPIFYVSIGFTNVEVGILASVLYLGAICQPLVGYICDISGNKKLILTSLFILIIIIAIIMINITNFYIMAILSFGLSACRMPMFGIMDDMSVTYVQKVGGNYGLLRSGASWGYALGVFFLLPFYKIGFDNPVIILLILLCLVVTITLISLKDVGVREYKNKDNKESDKKQFRQEAKEKLLSKKYILLLIINVLLMGTGAAKMPYQTLKLELLGATMFLIALANFITIIPEMVFMPKVEKFLGHLSIKKILYLSLLVSVFQNSLIAFAPNSIFLVSVMWLHGILMAIYIPMFFIELKRYLGPTVSSTGILIISMTQGLGASMIGAFFITPIFSEFGIDVLYISCMLLMLTSVVPISMLDNEKKTA